MKKVKRKHINWVYVLEKTDNQDMFKYFFSLLGRIRHNKRGSHLSSNRCAYCTLKHFYSTTTIGELVEKLGL